jgi:hypothetical protein
VIRPAAFASKGDIWASYDPAQVRATLETMAGALSEADADRLVANLYRAREAGSRPPSRP